MNPAALLTGGAPDSVAPRPVVGLAGRARLTPTFTIHGMDYQLILLIAIVVIGSAMAVGARGKRVALERRLSLAERKLAQLVQKLAANGVEGMAEFWQQPLPPSANIAAGQLPGQARFGPLDDSIAQAEMGAGFDEVWSFLQQGKKIQAIKVYRELTGAGLKDAKDAVERMAGER